MSTPPYRTSNPRPGEREPATRPSGEGDGELLPVYAIVWVTTVAMVARGLARSETFGAGATLACIAVVVLPLAAKEAVRGLLSRARRGRGRRGG